eukprot:364201-Chlamydomonas_euryale.AAC.3
MLGPATVDMHSLQPRPKNHPTCGPTPVFGHAPNTILPAGPHPSSAMPPNTILPAGPHPSSAMPPKTILPAGPRPLQTRGRGRRMAVHRGESRLLGKVAWVGNGCKGWCKGLPYNASQPRQRLSGAAQALQGPPSAPTSNP